MGHRLDADDFDTLVALLADDSLRVIEEDRIGWSIKKFARATRRDRTIQVQAGAHTLTAADPLPDDLHRALAAIHNRVGGTH